MNNSYRFLMAVAVVFIAFTSCKKDKTPPSNNNNTTNNSNPMSQKVGGSASIPSGAAGALYALKEIIVDDGDSDESDFGFAWFGNAQSTDYAGPVTLNNEDMYDSIAGYKMQWYTSGFADFQSQNSVDWTVGGSSAVHAFDYTDSVAWPTCSFTLPAAVKMSQPLTINCSFSTKNDGVFFIIWGPSQHKLVKEMPANSTSATFSAADLQSVTAAGDDIAVQVMPVTSHGVTFNGKKYYFVKQTAVSQETATE